MRVWIVQASIHPGGGGVRGEYLTLHETEAAADAYIVYEVFKRNEDVEPMHATWEKQHFAKVELEPWISPHKTISEKFIKEFNKQKLLRTPT